MSGGGGDYEHLPMYASSSVTSSSASSSRHRLLSNATAISSRTAPNAYANMNGDVYANEPITHTITNNLDASNDTNNTNYNNSNPYGRPPHSHSKYPNNSGSLSLLGSNAASNHQRQRSTSNTWSRIRPPRRHSSSSSSPPPFSPPHSNPNSNWMSITSPFEAYINTQGLPRLSTIKHTLRQFFKLPNLRRITIKNFKPRHLLSFILFILIYAIPGAIIFLILLFTFYEPHVEVKLYSRKWIKEEVDSTSSLAGCFSRQENEGGYNMTERVWHKTSRWEVQSGVEMKRGMQCYQFAGMIGKEHPYPGADRWKHQDNIIYAPTWIPSEERTTYHTYWRADLVPFGPRQEQMIKSFFATQPLRSSQLILWSNGDLSSNPLLLTYLIQFPDSFSLRRVDVNQMAKGTALEDSERLARKDKKAWVDGDLVRLLVLWNFGGVWVDMDSLLTRSLEPLLEHEFVTQWDCYNKPYTPLNGALMHFHAHSPYLCEAFHLMASSSPPRPGTTDWGSLLYIKLWKRLVSAGIPPFKVLPWCFSDGRSCRIDNRLPDPFRKDGEGQGRWIASASPGGGSRSKDDEGTWTGVMKAGVQKVMSMEEGGLLDEVLHNVFSVHLHNQWEKEFPKGGWVERLLLRRYEDALQAMERERQNRGLEKRVELDVEHVEALQETSDIREAST